jgi:peptidyl-dipeptidase A
MKKHLFVFIALAVAACSQQSADAPVAVAGPTETADEFVARMNDELRDLGRELGAAGWVRATYITDDTAIIASAARERYSEWHSRMVKQSMQYDGQALAPATRRAMDLLKLGTSAPAPNDAAKRREIAEITTDLGGMYGAGEYCHSDTDCRGGQELEELMTESRNYDELLDAWQGWRTIAVPMRSKYERFVELANEGANELGYADLGEMWKSEYDMSAREFQTDATRL